MKTLSRLSGLLLLLILAQLSSCTAGQHAAQAPRPARHTYHQAERTHARARHRAVPFYLPWN